MNKIFIWWFDDNSYENDCITYGPHYWGDEQLIGKNIYHTLEDLLKIGLSDSIKKRLTTAKIGTCIKVMKYGTRGDLMLKCISEDKVDYANEVKNIDNKISLMHKEIMELEKKREIEYQIT